LQEFEYNFTTCIIYRYLNLEKNQRIILQQIENSQMATTLKSGKDYGKNI